MKNTIDSCNVDFYIINCDSVDKFMLKVDEI